MFQAPTQAHPSSILALPLLLLLALLAGCAGTPLPSSESTPAPRTGGGGYYKDDGPGDRDVDVSTIPDAVPQPEKLNRFTNRPYTVFGRTYVPMTALEPYRARGVATWYGRRYHGQKTSSGEPYDMYAMTAAHTTLPIPSYARVTNLDNGRSVVVRVNDRGPFVDNRLIDLSWTAATKLGIIENGQGFVEVELIDPRKPGEHAPLVTAPDRPVAPPSAAIEHEASGWFLQLGAFDSHDNAESFIAQIAPRLGGEAARLGVLRDGVRHKVQYGPFASREAAYQAANDLRQRLALESFLVGR